MMYVKKGDRVRVVIGDVSFVGHEGQVIGFKEMIGMDDDELPVVALEVSMPKAWLERIDDASDHD